jgi:LuxR family maltose regulon positive regulatory protein
MATRAATGFSARTTEDVNAEAVPRLVDGLIRRVRLFAVLDRGGPGSVTVVSAPAGSGKTLLVSSWLRCTEAAEAVAWVGVERDETDATRFWGMVMDALRDAGAVPPDDPLATLVPDSRTGADEFVHRLLEGLGRLEGGVSLVLDDLHQLRSEDALRGVEQLLARMPAALRVFVLTRYDPGLGLHRLRLSGALTEIRAADLRFTAEEAAELMAAAGVAVPAGDLSRLHRRTEGWAAGLRLAAMSLARHDAPERFVEEFSGSERTVGDYLLAEVLALQRPEVRRLLLRTCILERVNGPLADLLTGGRDGSRLLLGLEEANAFVVAVDAGRSWFRYHHLLVDLLRLELRREAAEEVPELHRRAAGWHAEHGHVVEAIRHAELGEDWGLASELLGRNWVELVFHGEEATLGSLLAGLPSELAESDAEVATMIAGERLRESRWTEADELLASAQGRLAGVPRPRRRRAETALATVQLLRARRLGDVEEVVDGARAALDVDGEGDERAGVELRALALMNLGIAEAWTRRFPDAELHLAQALALGREIGSPHLEIGCLATLGGVANVSNRLSLSEEVLRRAIAVAERVGWATHPFAGVAYMSLGALLIDWGAVADGEQWLERADPILERAPEPAASVGLRHAQGRLAIYRGRFDEAVAAFADGERLAEQLRAPHYLGAVARQWRLRALLLLGDAEPVRAELAEAGAEARGVAQWCSLEARLRLADGDFQRAADAVAPVLAGTALALHINMEIEALLLDAVARTELGELDAAERSVERALELAEPEGRVWAVLTVPGARELLQRHPSHRTAHAAHLRLLLDHLAGAEPTSEAPQEPREPLSDRELTVLRFLPTNLSAAEIGRELFVSVHTVKTHMRKLYAKLDVHTRADAVQRGRALGLLAPARRDR